MFFYMLWPNMNANLKAKVGSCEQCQSSHLPPAVAPLHPWELPGRPRSRLRFDYVGPFHAKIFLVLVDAHSKWIEVFPVQSATSILTIEKLRIAFSTHGLPEKIVTDNGCVFTRAKFNEFIEKNGIRHICTSPYHPASNGLAERAIQTFKH